MVESLTALPSRGCGNRLNERQIVHGVTKLVDSGIVLERRTIEGASPVDESCQLSLIGHPSTMGHEKSCGNLGGPSPKAKYSPMTDSEQVP